MTQAFSFSTKQTTTAELADSLSYEVLKGQDWAPALAALHTRIRDELPEEKKHGFLPRGADYFAPLLDGRGGTVWGAFNDDGNLVGLCAVLLKSSWLGAKMGGALTCPDEDGHLSRLCGQQTIAVIQSLGVLSTYKGCGVGQDLIKEACLWAFSKGIGRVFAQVAQDNKCSWLQFLRQGFGIVRGWNGADHSRYLLSRSLSPFMFIQPHMVQRATLGR